MCGPPSPQHFSALCQPQSPHRIRIPVGVSHPFPDRSRIRKHRLLPPIRAVWTAGHRRRIIIIMRSCIAILAIWVLTLAEPLAWANVDLRRSGDDGRSEASSGPSDSLPVCFTSRLEWQSQVSDSSRRCVGSFARLAGHPLVAVPCCRPFELWTQPSAFSHSLQVEHVRLQI